MKKIFLLFSFAVVLGIFHSHSQCGITADITTTPMDCPNGGSVCFTLNGGVAPYVVHLILPGFAVPIQLIGADAGIQACFSDVIADTYSLRVTDDSDCIQEFPVVVSSSSALNVDVVLGTNYCNGNGTIDVTVTLSGVPQAGYDVEADMVGYAVSGTTDANGFVHLEVIYEDYPYLVSVNNGQGCGYYEFVNVNTTGPLAFNNVQGNFGCFEDGGGSININVAFGGTCTFIYDVVCTNCGSPYSDQQTTSSTSTSFYGLPAGLYDVSVTCPDCNGTITEQNVLVEVSNPIVIESAVENLCTTDCTGSIDITASGGSGSGFSYEWNLNGGFFSSSQDLSNLCEGTYSITVSDLGNYCQNGETFILQPFEIISATFDGNSSCHLAANGNATVVVSNSTSPYNWFVGGLNWNNNIYPDYDPNATTVSMNGFGLGTFLIGVTNGDGCYVEVELIVDESQVPQGLELQATQATAACNGSGGSATTSNTSGFPISYYWWFDCNCACANGCVDTYSDFANCYLGCAIQEGPTANSLTNVGLGCYTVWAEYINAGNYICYDMAAVCITGSTFTVALTASNEVGCNTPSTGLIDITVTPAGAYTYSWIQTESTGDDDNNIDVPGNTPYYTQCTTPLANLTQEDLVTSCAGLWTVTVTDGNGCVAPPLEIDALIEPLLMADGTISGYDNPYDNGTGTTTIDVSATTPDLPVGDEVHIGSSVHLIAGSGIWHMQGNTIEFAYDKYLRAVASGTITSELEADNTTFFNLCPLTWWRGLEIQGAGWYEGSNPNYTNNVSSVADLDGCTISCAFTGIRNHPVPTWNVNAMNITVFNATGWNSSYGGMIEADNCTFLNNMRDVNLCGTKQVAYNPYFDGCTFRLTDDVFDVPSNWTGPAQYTRERIFLSQGVRHPHFHNCYLINEATELIQERELIGLRVFGGASFTFDNPVDGQIKGFTIGLNLEDNIFEPVITIPPGATFSDPTWNTLENQTIWIDNVDFNCYRDIYINNVNRALVYRCNFDFLPDWYPVVLGGWGNGDWNECTNVPAYGLYINSDMPYEVGLNDFIGTALVDCSYGFVANNNGGNQNHVFQNTFSIFNTEDKYAMSLQGLNRGSLISTGLHYTCNHFFDCYYDVSVIGSSAQGVATPQQGAGPDDSAGNQFSSDPFDGDTDYEQIWDEAAGHTYRYVITDVIDLPELSPTVTPDLVDISGSCNEYPDDPAFAPGGGEEQFMQRTAEYNASKSQWLALVDGGNTEALTVEVISTTFSEALVTYYELMSQSPNLSEVVLLATIEKEYELPNVLVKQILASNPQAAKSPNVRESMENKMIPFDEFQEAEIMEGLTWVSAKEELEFEMAASLFQRSIEFNRLRSAIETDPTVENKTATLLGYLSPSLITSDAYLTADIYLSAGDLQGALATLQNIQIDFTLNDEEVASLENYMALLQLGNELQAQESALLSETQVEDLENIFSSSAGKDGSLALSLLKQYSDYQYDEPLRKRNPNFEFRGMQMVNEFVPLFSFYPNPTSDFVVFKRVNATGEFNLALIDVTGRIVLHAQIKDGEAELMIDLLTLASGTYMLNVTDPTGHSVHATAVSKQ